MNNEEINPNEVWGSWFRLPSIEGHGSGDGFGFSNLALPRRWDEIKSFKDNSYFQKAMEAYANNAAGRFGLSIRSITWDENTGILKSVEIKEGNACGIYLSTRYPSSEQGAYYGHNVDTLHQAHCLFTIVSRFINECLDRIYKELEEV